MRTPSKSPRPAFSWMNEVSRRFLGTDYLPDGQTGETRVGVVAQAVGRRFGRPDLADKFYDYSSRGWYSMASPVWSNFGTDRGMPISCFGTQMEDTSESIQMAVSEIAMMSKHGGGTSLYAGNLRGRGADIQGGRNGKSGGSVHFAGLVDATIRVWSQGSSRRGECAIYWPIDHPDVREALLIRTGAGGHDLQKINYGLTIRDEWMRSMIAGDKAKRQLWAEVLNTRMKHGRPYLMFVDNANRRAPKEYKDRGLEITHSNLCTEIMLADTLQESFVCCLSSMNVLHFDEWKDTDAVEVMVYYLDAVMSEFIEKSEGKYGMERARRFAVNQRALGIGQLGWHNYLQERLIPYDSMRANSEAAAVSRAINEAAHAASRKMAAEYGEPEYLKGSGRRHMTLTAVAPTQSSSAILGQMTEGTEPEIANITVKDKQKIKYTHYNPQLMRLLGEKGKDTAAVIDSIKDNRGSVQHLDFFSPEEKAAYKTTREIRQMASVQQAAARLRYIDQGQSLNLLIDPETSPKEVTALYVAAWELGLKTMYYQHNVSAVQECTFNLTSCDSCGG